VAQEGVAGRAVVADLLVDLAEDAPRRGVARRHRARLLQEAQRALGVAPDVGLHSLPEQLIGIDLVLGILRVLRLLRLLGLLDVPGVSFALVLVLAVVIDACDALVMVLLRWRVGLGHVDHDLVVRRWRRRAGRGRAAGRGLRAGLARGCRRRR